MRNKRYKIAEYVRAFSEVHLAAPHKRMLQAHYHAPRRTLTARQMSEALGYRNYNAANLQYGKLGGLVGERLGWSPLPEYAVEVLATFKKIPGRELLWIMRDSVAEALEQLGWVEGECHSIAEEVAVTTHLWEGAVRKISVNAYERSSKARNECIRHYGCRCAACGLMLAEKYGDAVQGLIHVHHLRDLAGINARYQVDPVQDLRPVCPTCHAVIHSRTPPFTVEELVGMIEARKRQW